MPFKEPIRIPLADPHLGPLRGWGDVAVLVAWLPISIPVGSILAALILWSFAREALANRLFVLSCRFSNWQLERKLRKRATSEEST